ncbi:unnamed protein product, partial [Effrenium voratum]
QAFSAMRTLSERPQTDGEGFQPSQFFEALEVVECIGNACQDGVTLTRLAIVNRSLNKMILNQGFISRRRAELASADSWWSAKDVYFESLELFQVCVGFRQYLRERPTTPSLKPDLSLHSPCDWVDALEESDEEDGFEL